MRPHVTPQNTWAQFGIGACALLLPPLALGAALYSMLAPDQGTTHPAGVHQMDTQVDTRAALPDTPGPAALIARPAKAEPVASHPPAGKSAEDVARTWDQVLAQGGHVTSGQGSSGQSNFVRVTSVPVTSAQLALPPAAAVNPRMAGGAPPMVDGSPAPAAPKRTNRRHTQRPQEEYPLQNWLRQIGILPPNSNGRGG